MSSILSPFMMQCNFGFLTLTFPPPSSPLRVKEDDEVDNLDIKLVKRKSKRVYQSPPPEVGLKISRSLKVSLSASTLPEMLHVNWMT